MGSALQENPLGVTAWVVVMVLLGGISFLYSSKHFWVSRILALAAVFALGLPFTVSAMVWQGQVNALGFFFWLLFLPAQALLLIGYIRYILIQDENQLINLPRWAQASFPGGLAVMFIPLVVMSLWGWDGALKIGNWFAAVFTVLLSVGMLFFVYRLSSGATIPAQNQTVLPTRFAGIQQKLINIITSAYNVLGRFLIFTSDLFEGDGSLLWTFVLLVLFISVFQG